MAVDATTVNAANGLEEPDMKVSKMAFIAGVFGLMQFIMPCIGYFIGYIFKSFLEAWIPWIAFALLTILAIKTFIDWLKERKGEEEVEKKKIGFGTIMLQGVATSYPNGRGYSLPSSSYASASKSSWKAFSNICGRGY